MNLNQPINGISPEKLKILSEIIKQSENVSGENMIPFFLNAAANANAKGISFSDDETELIINALKTNMTQEQINRLETVRRLAKMIQANGTPNSSPSNHARSTPAASNKNSAGNGISGRK